MHVNWRSPLVIAALGLVGVVMVITVAAWLMQTNPPVKQEPAWDTPQTRALAKRACFDCHSNETVWTIYTRLPVGSWIAVFDTMRGRRELNFSEWTAKRGISNEIGEVVNEGEMPPAIYLGMHPEAVLTAAEKQQLITGLQKSLK